MRTKINFRISDDGSAFYFSSQYNPIKIGWDIFDGDKNLGCLFFYDSFPNSRRMSKYWKEYLFD